MNIRNNSSILPSPLGLVSFLKQAHVAGFYALILYLGDVLFESEDAFGYFEASTGFALAVILLGGKQYAWSLLLGGALLRFGTNEQFNDAVIASSGDTLQALLGAWLINHKRIFDPHLKTLRDYLVLVLLGGCASMAAGSLLTNTTSLFFGSLTTDDYFNALLRWWMSDTLGIILITPLILLWWQKDIEWLKSARIFEALTVFSLTVLACEWIFLNLGQDHFIGHAAKSYWMFLIVTWAAVRLGTRETMVVLVLTATYALLGAISGSGYFANDIEESLLANYWFYMTILSVVGMALATHFTERKLTERAIHNLAFYDPLTTLANRCLLIERLQQEQADSSRSGRHGMLMFIDLDHFKTLNDSLGHDFGDILLQQVAQRLAGSVQKSDAVARLSDTVARLGGDEFVMALGELSIDPIDAATQAGIISNKILAVINQPYQLAGHEYRCTASIGVSLFLGNDPPVDELLKQADIAMYQAKRAGRNTMKFFDPKMQTAIIARAAMEIELRKALELRQFQLYYQLQVDSSYRPLGAETLIRWKHPEQGMVSPMQFIPLAEETGLILQIGQWVIESACAQIKAWQQNDLTRDLTLAVNVSAKQFLQTDFITQVKNSVLHHGIPPNLLKLEITESTLQEDIETTIATMNTLKEFGVLFSMDDFGTGYSSLQ